MTERAVYIAVLVILVILGIWQTEVALSLIKAFTEAMSVILTTTP